MRTPIKCAKYSALIVVCLAFFVACGTAAVSFGTNADRGVSRVLCRMRHGGGVLWHER